MTTWAADSAPIVVSNVWSRLLPPVVPNGVVYMKLVNNGVTSERLTKISGNISNKIEIHQTVEENGLIKMQRQGEGIVIPSGKAVTFQPSGLHVMLVSLVEPLREGQTFPLTLHFERGTTVEIMVLVQKMPPQ